MIFVILISILLVYPYSRLINQFNSHFLHKEFNDFTHTVFSINRSYNIKDILLKILSSTKTFLISCCSLIALNLILKLSNAPKFGGAQVGYIGNKSTHQIITLKKFPDDCFDQVNVTYNKKDSETVHLEFKAGKKRIQGCSEWYYVGTSANLHIASLDINKDHIFTWKHLTQIEMKNIQKWAIHIFRGCDHMRNVLPNILQTVQLFLGGFGTNPKIPFFGSKPPKYMQQLNVKFIQKGIGYKWQNRPNVYVDLNQLEVYPGDFLAITRFDGIDQLINYGAGSFSGHSAVILQVDNQLVVCQSQDGSYWPKHGIQRNSWKQWKKWAKNSDFNVAVLPLSQQSRKKFNVTAAAQYFKKLEGLPYGYNNFLFGWIDTKKDNLPPVLDQNLLLVIFAYLERLQQKIIKRFLTQALNKRLNTQNENLNLSQITVQMANRNISFGDLLAIVQQDDWQYSDGFSRVCSAFVAGIYQAGGLLKNVQATQFTPKDVYTLQIFDKNYQVPEKCKKNDPKLPYCQIMGRYRMNLPGYSTITPYQHMAQHCPTLIPDFIRPQKC